MGNYYSSIITPQSLHKAWQIVCAKGSTGGIDGKTLSEFENKLKVNLDRLCSELRSGSWNPEPYLRIEIAKNDNEKRSLGLLCIKDKIVQQAIKTAIEPQMDRMFLNVSYGYRPEKGTEKAVRRLRHDIKQLKGCYIAKLDIDDFFDSISHERLFTRLGNWLQDDQTLGLIKLCIQTGSVTPQLGWTERKVGVPQGAVLSPLLANFYLHPFDQFAISKVPVYVRYADDFVIASKTEEELKEHIQLIGKQLANQFSLRLNEPVISTSVTGTEFLGVIISEQNISITEKKKQELIERIQSITLINSALTPKANETLKGIKNYYARLLPQEILHDFDSALVERLSSLIKSGKNNISSVKALNQSLQSIEFFSNNAIDKKKQLVQNLISTYCIYNGKQPNIKRDKTDNAKLIAKKKRQYQKLENAGAELVVNTPGCFIGKTYKGIVVKLQGKIVSKPSAALRHITIVGKGISISSNALMHCMERKIPVEFFDGKGCQYATVLSPQSVDEKLWNKQVSLPLKRKVKLAAAIISGKLRNQLNLVKYYNKYHKDVVSNEQKAKYEEAILVLEQKVEESKKYNKETANYASELMAIEAQGAIVYWDYIRMLLADDGISFERREHQGATDIFNSLLNYGYSILYSRVWKNILAAKLNPSVGIIHAPQNGKPTLVYDVVELFRSQMVDRVVISMIQRKMPVEIKDGLLTDATKRLLIRHILERLNRYEKFRKSELTLSQIIASQAQEIAKSISDENVTFRPYVAKW